MKLRLAKAVGMISAVFWLLPLAHAQDIDRGRELSIKHCAYCHVIGDFNKFGGIGSTPSFRVLASLKDGEARFHTFHTRRPHQSIVFLPDQKPPTKVPLRSPPIEIGYEDIADIAAYGMTQHDPKFAR